jgi:hypothetical protein
MPWFEVAMHEAPTPVDQLQAALRSGRHFRELCILQPDGRRIPARISRPSATRLAAISISKRSQR